MKKNNTDEKNLNILTVEKIVAGGDGLCRTENGVVFIPNVLPGEKIRIEIISQKKGFARGSAVEIVEPSPYRVTPECPLFGECGGCAWQHIEYTEQLKLKAEIVKEAFTRIGGVEISTPEIMGTATGYGTRNRFRFRTENGKYSLLKQKSRESVPIFQCPVAVEEINLHLKKKEPRHGENEVTLFGFGGRCFSSEEESEAEVTLLGKRFRFGTSHFFQSNLDLFEKLIEEFIVNEKGESGKCALDLYCGAGIFSAFLADRFTEVIAVESFPEALPFLKVNCPKNVTGFTSPVEEFELPKGKFPELAVVDPPRTGLGRKAIEFLINGRPEKIIYISCDPVTMARDIGELTKEGYSISRHKLFDFYPQTPHIESVVILNHS